MRPWTPWIEIEAACARNGAFREFGVYQIRAVSTSGDPIPINRLIGTDANGILYTGRSGYRNGTGYRTIANRIAEFMNQRHSGGITYARARRWLQRDRRFANHRLNVRALFLPDSAIVATETLLLDTYFSRHGELPPCNSQAGSRTHGRHANAAG